MKFGSLTIIAIITLTSTAVFLYLPSSASTFAQEYLTSSNRNTNTTSSNAEDKVVIINFDDGYKSQYEYAKPILDKYGFKATFFVVCNYADKGQQQLQQQQEEEDKQVDAVNYIDEGRMSWNDIVRLYQEGHDIGAHTVSHDDLNKKTITQQELDYEIGQSKQCLLDHGIESNEFAYPFASGADNQRVVNTVAKYFTIARTGGGELEIISSDLNNSSNKGKDPPISINDSSEKFVDRYEIRAINHNSLSGNEDKDSSNALANFIDFVNSQSEYNNDGKINAIPIIVYHKLGCDNNNHPDDSKDEKEKHGKDEDNCSGRVTDVNLFDREMAYLYNNNFKVLTMKSLQNAFPDHSQNNPKEQLQQIDG